MLRKRLSILAAVGLGLSTSLGCGSGFTGGSIPTGGTRLVGNVVAAENTLTPVQGAVVTVTVLPVSNSNPPQQYITDQNGAFGFAHIPIAAQGSTTIQVTVAPAASSGRQSNQINYTVPSGRDADLLATLPPTSFNVNTAATVSISTLPSFPPNDTITMPAYIYDATGKLLPYGPSLLFVGNFGTLSLGSDFDASEGGTGTVFAFWYNLPVTYSSVVVNQYSPALPPSPPNSGGQGSGAGSGSGISPVLN